MQVIKWFEHTDLLYIEFADCRQQHCARRQRTGLAWVEYLMSCSVGVGG